MIYKGPSVPLDHKLILKPIFDDSLSPFVEGIRRQSGKTNRKDVVNNIRNALSVVLANLFRLAGTHPDWSLRIDLSNDGYPKGEFNPYRLNTSNMSAVVTYLEKHDPPLIERSGGNYDKDRGKGYPTKIVPSFELLEFIAGVCVKIIPIVRDNDIITTSTITRNVFCIVSNVNSYHLIFENQSQPTIRLKTEKLKGYYKYIRINYTGEIKQMKDNLEKYNDTLLNKYWVDIIIPDREFHKLRADESISIDEFGDNKENSYCLDLVSRRKLYRVFNDGTFQHGGRFYGGWWQDIPKKHRRYITINGRPTVEIDYSNMQIAMLYARVGLQLDGDAYTIAGIEEKYRDLIKTLTLKLINAKDRIKAPLKASYPPEWTFKKLTEAIQEKHRPIADFFRSGEGIRLQRTDSDIAEDVMMNMMETGVLVLPIHDSFVVASEHADKLQETMEWVYRKHMNGKGIRVKRDPTLIDELMANGDKTAHKAKTGMELLEERQAHSDYSDYRARQQNFKVWKEGKNPNPEESILSGPTALPSKAGNSIPPKPLKRLWDRFLGR